MADEKIDQNEIEALLNQSKDGASVSGDADKSDASDVDAANTAVQAAAPPAASEPQPAPAKPPSSSAGPGTAPTGNIPQGDIEALLNQAQEALESVDRAVEQLPPGIKRFELSTLSGTRASTDEATLDLIQDVELDLKIELGRTRMHLEDVLQLKRGSVVPLEKLAGDPVDVFVNGRLIARGEVLVLNDTFCIRVAELVAGETSA